MDKIEEFRVERLDQIKNEFKNDVKEIRDVFNNQYEELESIIKQLF